MKIGDRIISVGEIDWQGHMGREGPTGPVKGTIIAAPRTETEKRAGALPWSVIVEWDFDAPRRMWMTRNKFRVLGPLDRIVDATS